MNAIALFILVYCAYDSRLCSEERARWTRNFFGAMIVVCVLIDIAMHIWKGAA